MPSDFVHWSRADPSGAVEDESTCKAAYLGYISPERDHKQVMYQAFSRRIAYDQQLNRKDQNWNAKFYHRGHLIP